MIGDLSLFSAAVFMASFLVVRVFIVFAVSVDLSAVLVVMVLRDEYYRPREEFSMLLRS